MARYVIDATTLVHVIESNSQIDSSHQLVAPNGIRSQALTLLLLAFRHGDYSESIALKHQERLTEVKLRLLGDRMSRRTTWRIAIE